MGTINTILDKVVPRVQRREHENKPLIDIINEEIEKEKCLGTEQSNQSTWKNHQWNYTTNRRLWIWSKALKYY